MVSYYNLALVPRSQALVESVTMLASANFAGQASDYILGTHALPHVTLCQFKAEPETLAFVFAALEPVVIDLQFTGIYIRPGAKIHQGKYWAGLYVKVAPSLLDLQKQMTETLKILDLVCLTDSDSYVPHLTWARLNVDKPIAFTVLPDQSTFTQTYKFDLTVGESNELGMYSKPLWPECAMPE